MHGHMNVKYVSLFIIKKSVTMHGHMNVKYVSSFISFPKPNFYIHILVFSTWWWWNGTAETCCTKVNKLTYGVRVLRLDLKSF